MGEQKAPPLIELTTDLGRQLTEQRVAEQQAGRVAGTAAQAGVRPYALTGFP